MPMMNEDMVGDGGMNAPEPAENETTEKETPSVFLTRAELGDHKCKVGDTISLKVTDVDPESGEVQAEIADYGDENKPGYEQDFDKAVPEESGA